MEIDRVLYNQRGINFWRTFAPTDDLLAMSNVGGRSSIISAVFIFRPETINLLIWLGF